MKRWQVDAAARIGPDDRRWHPRMPHASRRLAIGHRGRQAGRPRRPFEVERRSYRVLTWEDRRRHAARPAPRLSGWLSSVPGRGSPQPRRAGADRQHPNNAPEFFTWAPGRPGETERRGFYYCDISASPDVYVRMTATSTATGHWSTGIPTPVRMTTTRMATMVTPMASCTTASSDRAPASAPSQRRLRSWRRPPARRPSSSPGRAASLSWQISSTTSATRSPPCPSPSPFSCAHRARGAIRGAGRRSRDLRLSLRCRGRGGATPDRSHRAGTSWCSGGGRHRRCRG